MTSVFSERPRGPALTQDDANERLKAADANVPASGTHGIGLPKKFLKGVAISVWQNAGGLNSNWGRFAEATGKLFGLIPNIMDRSHPNDGGTGFWDRYKEDIKLAKDLGVTAFRFSIEWHRIEPEEGYIDAEAVQRYHDIITAVLDAGMYPSATLHHFVHPDWWDKKGGFEKEENIQAFVDFCVLCAKEYGSRIQHWATFNEPSCALVCGWLVGAHPPGKLLQIWLMGTVLLNMMKSHTAAYKAMKAAVKPDVDLQIGLVHHHVEFMPLRSWYFWVKGFAWWGTYWWGRDVILNYLQTGKFQWLVPLWGKTIDYEGEKPGLDWWGINYYTRGTIGFFMQPAGLKSEVMTDMQYTLYPQGLYENIVRGSALKVPMYISEIGCADKSADDRIRKTHIESFMGQMFKAIRDGYDVRGVFFWTLVDNFEWNTGYVMKFGLYGWDPSKPREYRKLKDGGRLLAKFFNTMPEGLTDIYNHCQENIHVSDYEAQLARAYEKATVMPVIWNKGRLVSVKPLTPLHLRIGLHDIDPVLPPERVPQRTNDEVPEDVLQPACFESTADVMGSAVPA